MRDFCPGGFPTSGSPGSSSSRHRYSCRRDTPNSLVRATMFSQPLIRSTATCRKCSEYRLFATRSFLSCKVCLLLLSHFWGSLQRHKCLQFGATRSNRVRHKSLMNLCVSATCAHSFSSLPTSSGELSRQRPRVRVPSSPPFI